MLEILPAIWARVDIVAGWRLSGRQVRVTLDNRVTQLGVEVHTFGSAYEAQKWVELLGMQYTAMTTEEVEE